MENFNLHEKMARIIIFILNNNKTAERVNSERNKCGFYQE
jgi:hypothetical protein